MPGRVLVDGFSQIAFPSRATADLVSPPGREAKRPGVIPAFVIRMWAASPKSRQRSFVGFLISPALAWAGAKSAYNCAQV
jgi:hypothetical protein